MPTKIQLTIATDGERCGECEHRNAVVTNGLPIVVCKVFDGYALWNPYRLQPCLDAEVKDG